MIGQSPFAYYPSSVGNTVFPNPKQKALKTHAIKKLSLKNLSAKGTVPSSLSSMQADGPQLMKANKIMRNYGCTYCMVISLHTWKSRSLSGMRIKLFAIELRSCTLVNKVVTKIPKQSVKIVLVNIGIEFQPLFTWSQQPGEPPALLSGRSEFKPRMFIIIKIINIKH